MADQDIQWCSCHQTLRAPAAIRDILAEAREFLQEPSRDEMSDIMYGIGRLLGSLVNRPYVHVPGDRLHIEKIEKRVQEYGCVRSKRHLVDGKCPGIGSA